MACPRLYRGRPELPGLERAVMSAEVLLTRTPWTIVGMSRATFKRLESQGRTPPPVMVGTSQPRYRVEDLRRWVESLKPDRRVRRGPQPARTTPPSDSA